MIEYQKTHFLNIISSILMFDMSCKTRKSYVIFYNQVINMKPTFAFSKTSVSLLKIKIKTLITLVLLDINFICRRECSLPVCIDEPYQF